MENTDWSCCIHGHEEGADDEGYHEDHAKRTNGWTDLVMYGWQIIKSEETHNDVADAHRQFSKQVEDASKSSSECEGHWVLQDQKESINGGCAEVLTCQRDLAVSIFVDILDETMAAVKTATDSLEKTGKSWSHLTTIVFYFPFDILKYNSDHPNKSDDKWAEEQATKIVAQSPPIALPNAEITTLVSVFSEIPRADCHNKHVVCAGYQKGSHPEEIEGCTK